MKKTKKVREGFQKPPLYRYSPYCLPNIPNLGIKRSPIGNETFPDWEQMLSHRFAASIQPLS